MDDFKNKITFPSYIHKAYTLYLGGSVTWGFAQPTTRSFDDDIVMVFLFH